MKLAKNLLIAGGVLNAVFVLFHVWLGWRIHHMGLPPATRSLMEMLNGGGTLFILFLAVTGLCCAREMCTTRLGQLVLATGGALYLLRAAAEFVVAPRVTPLIVAVCVLAGGLLLAALAVIRRLPAADGRAAGGSVREEPSLQA